MLWGWQCRCEEPPEPSLRQAITFQKARHLLRVTTAGGGSGVAPGPAGKLLLLILGLHDTMVFLLPQFPAMASLLPVRMGPGLFLLLQAALGAS